MDLLEGRLLCGFGVGASENVVRKSIDLHCKNCDSRKAMFQSVELSHTFPRFQCFTRCFCISEASQQRASQPAKQPAAQAASHQASQPASQAASQPSSQPARQAASQPDSQPPSQADSPQGQDQESLGTMCHRDGPAATSHSADSLRK